MRHRKAGKKLDRRDQERVALYRNLTISLIERFGTPKEYILTSVAKTHRAILLHEDSKRGGVGAELAAILAEKAIYDLEAPILRVAAPDMPSPYSPPLETAYLPNAGDVVAAARSLME